MSRRNGWIFILLFSLSLNIFHGFLTNHHENSHDGYTVDIDHDDLCDKCHCLHHNFTLNTTQIELPNIELLKPKFEQLVVVLISNKSTLFKPPTV